MTEEEFVGLLKRMRKLHRGERRRAWWRQRRETLALSAVFCLAACALWSEDSLESACMATVGLLFALVALC